MNWKRILANLGGIAAAAFGAALAGTPATSPISVKGAAAVAGVAVVTNLVGLFQPQPHKD